MKCRNTLCMAAGEQAIISTSQRKSDEILRSLSTFFDGLIKPRRRASQIGGDAVLSGSRSFQIEQLFLSLKAPTVACKIAVSPNDAMAGNGHRDAVRGAGSGHGTGSRRLPD